MWQFGTLDAVWITFSTSACMHVLCGCFGKEVLIPDLLTYILVIFALPSITLCTCPLVAYIYCAISVIEMSLPCVQKVMIMIMPDLVHMVIDND